MSRPLQQLFDLEGRRALVTGGSRGLGLQIAEALGEAGASVLITARSADELEEARAHLHSCGIEAMAIAADASQPAELQRLAEEALHRLGQVDILVNNAGTAWGAPAEEHSLEAWDKVMNLNLRAVFLLCQQIGRRSMIPRRKGRILNIASIAGLAGSGHLEGMRAVAYGASKAGLINLTRSLAAEWGRYGINVNALAPGFFPSRMTQGLLDRVGAANVAARAPLARLGDDEDLKGPALLLCCDAGKHITGQVLAVDGGVSAVLGG